MSKQMIIGTYPSPDEIGITYRYTITCRHTEEGQSWSAEIFREGELFGRPNAMYQFNAPIEQMVEELVRLWIRNKISSQ